jgi:putative MATE family efflux protein
MRKIDMTHGPLASSLFYFALPIVITGILQQLFNTADVAVIGTFVGKEAMAGVGTCSPIVGIIVSLCEGLSLGATVVISTAIGQKNKKRITHGVHSAILLSLIFGLLLSTIMESLLIVLLKAMNVPQDVFPFARLYLRVYCVGLIIINLYNFEAAILRSAGHSKEPLYALIVSGVINVVLNLFFVLVVKLNVAGVALATVIANGVSAYLLWRILTSLEEDIRVTPAKLKMDPRLIKDILIVGAPAGLQGMLFDIANMIIQGAMNTLGTNVIAGSSAAFNIEIFIYYLIVGFAQACTAFVGQNNGAGQLERCKATLKDSLIIAGSATALLCLIIYSFGRPLLSLFTSSEAVKNIGMIQIYYMCIMYMFSMVQEVSSGYLRGFGVSIIPTIISIVGICGLRILWIVTIFRAHPTFTNLMLIYPISQGVTGLIIFLADLIYTKKRAAAY